MKDSAARQEATGLLRRWRRGDAAARDELMALVYPELRRLARRRLAGERRDHTLDATALVHEAYLRLMGAEIEWVDRAHFLAVAARLMRRILVDYGKSRRRQKRGGDRVRITLDDGVAEVAAPAADVVALDRALGELAAIDERKARVVELHFFGGMTYDETAEALGVSPATVSRELRFAKAWLHDRLSQGDG